MQGSTLAALSLLKIYYLNGKYQFRNIINEKTTKNINIITTSLKHLYYVYLQYIIIIQYFGSTSGNAHSALKKIYGIYIEGPDNRLCRNNAFAELYVNRTEFSSHRKHDLSP